MVFTACYGELMSEEPLTYTVCDAYRYFASQALLIRLRHKVGQPQNIYYQRIIL